VAFAADAFALAVKDSADKSDVEASRSPPFRNSDAFGFEGGLHGGAIVDHSMALNVLAITITFTRYC